MNLKNTAAVFLATAAVSTFVVVCAVSEKDDGVIERRAIFVAHRGVFLTLAAMMQEDDRIDKVASWGVLVKESLLTVHPPAEAMSGERYASYLSNLGVVSGTSIYRMLEPSAICITMRSSGWASDTSHSSICRFAQIKAPDAFNLPGKGGRNFSFSRLEGEWYIEDDSK